MNNTAVLEKSYKILSYMDDRTPALARSECMELIDAAKAEMNAQTARQGGKREAYAAAQRILKNAEKDVLKKAMAASDGEQVICDGYRLVKLSEPLPLPQCEGGEIAKTFERILRDSSNNLGEKITPPPVAELRSFIAIKKAEAKAEGKKLPAVVYSLADGIYVDAQYLVDILQILPDAVIFPSSVDWRRGTSPLYFKSERGEAALCPVRAPKD